MSEALIDTKATIERILRGIGNPQDDYGQGLKDGFTACLLLLRGLPVGRDDGDW